MTSAYSIRKETYLVKRIFRKENNLQRERCYSQKRHSKDIHLANHSLMGVFKI